MEFIREIFFRMFMITRKWEVIFNRDSRELTLKQLMCLIVVNNAFEQDPTIKEIAGVLSTSHQNVKALVLQLEKKAFVKLYTDPSDKRITRVQASDERRAFWEEQNKKDQASLMRLFQNISTEELKITLETIQKLDENVNQAL